MEGGQERNNKTRAERTSPIQTTNPIRIIVKALLILHAACVGRFILFIFENRKIRI